MAEEIDWSKRADYIRARHGVEPAWASDAVNDPVAYWLDPDSASSSGRSVRVIGYSASADAVLTVILLPVEADPSSGPMATGGCQRLAGQRPRPPHLPRETTMTSLDDLLEAEGDAAKRTPTPDDAAGEHRNLNRSVVFSVRLNPDEAAQLRRHAEQRGLPVRTLARAWILDRLHADSQDDLPRRVERLEQAVFRRSA